MQLRTMLVDDDPMALKTVFRLLQEVPEINVVYSTNNPETFLNEVLREKPELAVMDIDMPGRSGLDIAREIRKHLPDCEIIFVTAHNEFAREAFDVYAFGYIEKPVSMERFNQTIERLKKKFGLSEKRLELPYGREVLIVSLDHLIAVEADGRDTLLHLDSGVQPCSLSLGELDERLPEATFFKSSRSYIVNLQAVTAVQPESRTSYRVALRGGHQAYLSKRLYDDFRKKLKSLYP